MDKLPPELIHAIVAEIGEAESLKTCSLVARIFIESCQRTLFNSLIIAKDSEGGIEPVVLWSRLQESPHLGRYFESLVCLLPAIDAPQEELDAFCTVLDRLTNIRRCVLMGDPHSEPGEYRCQWHDLPSQLSGGIVKFIQRLQLSQLHISFASLPGDILTMFLAAAPTVTFYESSVDTVVATDLTAVSATVENLAVLCSPSIADALASSRYLPHVSRIRKLCVDDHTSSQTQTQPALADFVPLPSRLPCLRSIAIATSFDRRDDPSFVPMVASVAEAVSATLQEICVTYAPMYGPQLNSSLTPETIAGVEAAIIGCAGSPRIRWRLEPPTEAFFDTFSTSLVEGFPRLHKAGRILVEQYCADDEDLFSWVERFSR
ncbi:hypothetical protein MSAN_01813300 [Mycena sanguinolenta]|uniref:Uncharacterized protein n=1 Tax=Mycena sanguinolenta TaxID=230812 RepID=A0A8H7CQR5_9AGAR|nr:hypothetical protein MSAN_01813300 [Mycena sanguinolenta]